MTAKTKGAESVEEQATEAAKAASGEAIGESQPTPVTAKPVRQDGLQIDGFGLPVNGVARAKVLGALEVKDPVTAEVKWTDALAAKARELTEKHYG